MLDKDEKKKNQAKKNSKPLIMLEDQLKGNDNINNNLTDMNNNTSNNSANRLRLNITIIGKRKCGKSALIKSYLTKSFDKDNKDTTLDIFGKKILISGKEVSLVISEVSQDNSNFQLAKEIISPSHIIFICYSLEDDFQKLNEDVIEGSINLIETIDKNIPIFIVGCKFDLIKEENIDIKKILNEDELTPSGKNVQDYINNRRENFGNNFCGFYITSSLLNLNIQELFNDAIKTVAIPYIKKYQKKLEEVPTENIIQNEDNNNNKKKKIIENIPAPKIDTQIQIEDNGCLIV
jgi:GTPase SAR1 family protein